MTLRPQRPEPPGVQQLRARLDEAEQTLAALRNGDVDALMVGPDLYVLEASHAASNRLRSDVLAQMQDAVIATDAAGQLVYLNAAAEARYGARAGDVLGHGVERLYREEWLHADDAAQVDEARRLGRGWRGRSVHVLRDGTRLEVDSTHGSLVDESGKPWGRLAVVRDVTRQAAAEQALRDADRRKDAFIATLAHELRNPLAPIRNAVHILRIARDAATHDNALAIIDRQLGQMIHLVDDLLDASRISQGKLSLRTALVSVDEVLRNAAEACEAVVLRRSHRLVLEPAGEPLLVQGDATRLTQIVCNLLDNAAKYTPDGGLLRVSAQRDGPNARITVQDNGLGIPPDQHGHVFEMFSQVNRSLDRSQGGIGIGLALVRQLVELHGGNVQLSSEGDNRGSTFTVTLPLAPATASPSRHPAAGPHAGRSSSCRVLVVDDNRDSADSLLAMLELLGHRPRACYGGIDALAAAAAFDPEVALIDLGMPDLDGCTVARELRRRYAGRRLRLAALTGWGQERDRLRTRDAGFDEHFVKPVDPQALREWLAG